MKNQDVNPARSLCYGLLSKLFVFTTQSDRFGGVDSALEVLIQNPLDESSQKALIALRTFIQEKGHEALVQEYDNIFHMPHGQVMRTTASYYDEGLESGKKRVEVKNFLAKTRIRRDESKYKENEDSVGFLTTFMHELIELIISGEKSYENLQHCLFEEVINGFFDEFIEDLYANKNADAYKNIAIFFNAFMDFERLYFDMAKPPKKEKIVRVATESCEYISDAEAKRRAENKAKKEADFLKKSCNIDHGDEPSEF